MDNLCLPVGVSALAVAIADGLSDGDLNLLAALFTQLGDTLTTIAVQRSLRGGNPGGSVAIQS